MSNRSGQETIPPGLNSHCSVHVTDDPKSNFAGLSQNIENRKHMVYVLSVACSSVGPQLPLQVIFSALAALLVKFFF